MNLRQRLACFHTRLSERQIGVMQQTEHLPTGLNHYLQSPSRSPLHPIIEEDLEWLAQSDDHHIIDFNHSNYPPLLKELQDPPCLLFGLGNVEQARLPAFALVGARSASREGSQNASHFASALARRGLCITSGLAYGIDAAAHQGCLAQGKPTIAVIGTGIDITYPAAHRALANRIAEQGLILSIFPRKAKPLRHHFPQRNAIISGMSLGVLVVEAGVHSGALITARTATEQGREVCALPGSIHSPTSKGCHRLIRDGAKLVESCDDILAELEPLFQSYREKLDIKTVITTNDQQPAVEKPNPVNDQLSDGARQLLSYINYYLIHPDQLAEQSRMGINKITSALTELEMIGIIEQQNGLYRRTAVTVN